MKTMVPLFTVTLLSILSVACGRRDASVTIDHEQSPLRGLQVARSGADTDDLVHVAPEAVGWSSEKLEKARKFAEQIGSAAVMVLRDGKVFVSWGEVERNFKVHSIRKPFLSALYGIHVARGEIDLDATMEELKIDDIPPRLTPDEKQATVRDLLKSRSGVYHEAAAEAPVMVNSRPERGSHRPGSHYYYNNWDFNALGSIFEQETGTKIFEQLKKEIADPLGMQDFSLENCRYGYEKKKSMHPAYSFRMSARDMARFGLLYQRKGMWNGKRIVPEEWIEESTTSYSIAHEPSGQGYGYMWKIAPEGSGIAQSIGYPFFFHTGIGVHVLAVVPNLELVLIHRLNTDGEWVDPGEGLITLITMIIEARLPGGPGDLNGDAAENEIINDFQRRIDRLREKLKIPGMSVAVVQGQKIVLARGFGHADLEKGTPASESTPYQIASLTKPFAAALIMQLVESGQLDLDDGMEEILRDVHFPFPGETLKGYSSLCKKIKEMGENDSGPYARYRSLFQDYGQRGRIPTVRHHLTHTSQGTPGEAYRYNGFLFGLLTQVVEKVTGRPFRELLFDRIIEPLGMGDTVPSVSDVRDGEIVEARAKPYRIDKHGNPALSEFHENINAAAGMISTVIDLARFDVAMDKNVIASEASKKAMFTPTRSSSGGALPYGLGWFVQDYRGHELVWHYGHQPTYSSLILKIPGKQLTLILLANSDGASAPFGLGAGDVLESPFALAFIEIYAQIKD